MLKKTTLILLISFLISCNKEDKQDPYGISYNRIGHLTNTIQLYQLDSIYANDSIVRKKMNDQFINSANEIEIYEKGGAKLLILEPKKENDSTSTIETIQVIDPRYQTPSGLSTNSTFKDIKDYYTISKINNTLSTAVLFIDSIQAYVTIDKKVLTPELRMDTSTKIEASQIPNTAKIKHFWISWDNNY